MVYSERRLKDVRKSYGRFHADHMFVTRTLKYSEISVLLVCMFTMVMSETFVMFFTVRVECTDSNHHVV